MKDIRIFSVVILFLLIDHQVTFAQEARDSITAYTWFDGVVGQENTNLFNGIEYIEQHATVNDRQKFLGSVLFLPGNVVYGNEPYFNIELKYNVYDDLLLVKNLRGEAIELHKKRIKQFEIAGNSFVNVRDTLQGNASGFYEVLLNTPQIELLKKHRKKQRKFLDRAFTYYEFTDDTPQYVIFREGNYFPANTRREVIRVFPEKAAQLRDLYRTHRNLANQDKDQFMLQLLRSLNVSTPNFK